MCPKNIKKTKKHKIIFLSMAILSFLIILLLIFYNSLFQSFLNSLETRLYLNSLEKNQVTFCKDNVKQQCESIVSLSLMVADDNSKHARGLMYVKKLNKNEGMIFKYKEEKNLVFWMKNTFIPLDIVFLDKKFNIIGIIENMLPEGNNKNVPDNKLPRYRVNGKAKYAIELPASFIKAYDIKVGGKINIE